MENFNLFVKECSHWVEVFNLNNWDIRYIADENELEVRAYTRPDLESMTAIVALSTEWDWVEINDYEIARSAFHEICELLFYKLRYYLDEFYSDKFIDSLIHENIRVLENAVFNKYWNDKEGE